MDAEILQTLMLAAVGLLIVFTNRNKIANQALATAVNTQTSFNTFSQQLYEQQLRYAEEKGAYRVTVDALRADLKEEKDKYQALVEKMTITDTKNVAVLEQLRESQQNIEALQRQIARLESDMTDVRQRLLEAESAKALLEQERDRLQANLSGMEAQIDSKIKAAVDKAVAELRNEYESRLDDLNRQILAKDEEISRLKAAMEAQHAEKKSPDNPAGGGADAGGDASGGTG